MRKFVYWASIAAGITAAYLMYGRGVPLGTIAKQAVTDPLGTLVHEVQQAV